MGEIAVDVTVRTRFADPQTLMSAVGSWIERGCLRVPALIECGRPFEIELLTAAGATAVRGSAEGVRHDGNCTFVRFLSASRDQTDGGVWFDLADATVVVPTTLTASSKRARTASGEIKPKNPAGDWSVALGTPIPQPVPQGLRDLKGGAARGTPKSGTPKSGTAKTEVTPAPRVSQVPAVPPVPQRTTTQQRPVTQNTIDRSRLPPEPPGAARISPPGFASAMTIELIADLPPDVPTQPAAPLMAMAAVPMEIASTSAPAPVMTMTMEADEPVMLTQRAPAEGARSATDGVQGRGPVAPPRPHTPSGAPPVVGFVHVPLEAPPQPEGGRGGRPTTIPPPLVALWSPASTGNTGAFFFAPAPGGAPGEAPADGRVRPPTIPPPGWGAEPTASGMWIPVVDPALLQGVGQPPPVQAPAAETRPGRGPMTAAVAVAVAGAVVAIAAVLWARGVKTSAPPPLAAASKTAAAAVCPVVDPVKPAPTTAPAVAATTPPTTTPPSITTTATTTKPAPPAPPTPTPAPVAVGPVGDGPCSVAISTSAQDVKVFIAGEKRGVAPITLALPCEPVAVTFKHPRYTEQTKRITPTAETATLHVSMERPKALLKVVSRPAGASVAIDGREIGKTPVVKQVNAFKPITLTMKSPGMSTERRLVYPKRGTTVVSARLRKKR